LAKRRSRFALVFSPGLVMVFPQQLYDFRAFLRGLVWRDMVHLGCPERDRWGGSLSIGGCAPSSSLPDWPSARISQLRDLIPASVRSCGSFLAPWVPLLVGSPQRQSIGTRWESGSCVREPCTARYRAVHSVYLGLGAAPAGPAVSSGWTPLLPINFIF
jgi:hypothetical protein